MPKSSGLESKYQKESSACICIPTDPKPPAGHRPVAKSGNGAQQGGLGQKKDDCCLCDPNSGHSSDVEFAPRYGLSTR